MSSVDWGNATEVATGSQVSEAQERWSSRLRSSRLVKRLEGVSDLRARRVAALVFLAAFVLVVVAQWRPWFRLSALGLEFDNSPKELRTIDAINALYVLVVPYYVGWTLIAMAAGAAVFGRQRVRRTSAGIATGALVGQVLIVLATWHNDGVGGYNGLTSAEHALHSTRQPGIYFAVTALGVTALALIIAVRGRIMPMADDDAEPSAFSAREVRPPRASLAIEADADETPHEPNPRKGVRAGMPWVDGGEDLADGDGAPGLNGREPGEAEREATSMPAAHVDETDHTLYMRPQGAKIN